MMNAETFAGIDTRRLTAEEKEHITRLYYDRAREFRIINIESGDYRLANASRAIDTLENLSRLEKVL